jgi:hypothetical protein
MYSLIDPICLSVPSSLLSIFKNLKLLTRFMPYIMCQKIIVFSVRFSR